MVRMGSAPFDVRRVPVTVGFLALLVLGFLATVFSPQLALPFVFQAGSAPLSWITYPFVANGVTGVIFGGLWVWFTLGSLEPVRGWQWTASLTAAAIVIFPVLGFGLIAAAQRVVIGGAVLPIAALTMTWCALNAEAEVRLFGIIPLKGKWLALIEVALVLFGFGAGGVVAGVAFALALGPFWLIGQGKIPLPGSVRRNTRTETKQEREFDRFRDEIYRREKEREEKERLRKLFEASLHDDPKDDR